MSWLFIWISLSNKKESSADTCYSTAEHWKHFAEWKKPGTDSHMLCGSVRVTCTGSRSTQTENRAVIPGSGDGGTSEITGQQLTDPKFVRGDYGTLKSTKRMNAQLCEGTENQGPCTLDGRVVWHGNFISYNCFKKRIPFNLHEPQMHTLKTGILPSLQYCKAYIKRCKFTHTDTQTHAPLHTVSGAM